MFFGPIVSLEMVTGARRARYFVIRVLYALVLLVLLWFNFAEASFRASVTGQGTMSIQAVASFSQQFFTTFAFAQLIAVLLLTPAMIAGSIAQERERRTLEYMLISTLSGGEIVVSKFLARLLQVTSLLLTGLPILAIAMTLGGISLSLLLTAFAVTIATLVATASASIAVSVWAKRSRDAVVRTYALLLVFLTLPSLILVIGELGIGGTQVSAALKLCGAPTYVNPFFMLGACFAYTFAGNGLYPPGAVVTLLVTYALFSVIVLTWATVSVRRVYRKSIGAAEGSPRKRKSLLRRWRPQLGDRPMLWKELFASTAALNLGLLGRLAVILLFAGAVVPALLLFFYEVTRVNRGHGLNSELIATSMAVVTLLECAALVIVAIRAAGSITAEKERDSWLTLISTPLEPSEIVWGKMVGAIYAARWFALPIGIWWLLNAILSPQYVIVVPMQLAAFLCIALATAALGIWFSAWCRTSIRAMAATVAVGVFLGGGYLLCCTPFLFNSSFEFLFVVACIPFLLFSPVIIWFEFTEHRMGSDGIYAATACAMGLAGYLVFAWILTLANTRGFDRRAGRTTTSIFHPTSPPVPAQIAAENDHGPGDTV